MTSRAIAKHMHELPQGWSEWKLVSGSAYSVCEATGAVLTITPKRGVAFTVTPKEGDAKCFKALDRATNWGQSAA